MSEAELYVYRTDNPEALAAYRTAVAARAEFGHRLRADAAALGRNNGALVGDTAFGGPEKVVGLDPDTSGAIPAGWRIVRGRLEPAKRGQGAADARRWLDEHQPGADRDPRYVLKAHGLPYQSRVYLGGGSFHAHLPVLFEHDGQLWACYKGKPDGDFPGDPSGLTWPACPLGDYYAAKAAVVREQELAAAAGSGGRASRTLRHAPADWRAGRTRVVHADGQAGTFVGNSLPLPDVTPRGWLGVLVRFDGETDPVDVDPADLVVEPPPSVVEPTLPGMDVREAHAGALQEQAQE